MSELMNTRNAKTDFRWQLLTTVSALALLAAVYGRANPKPPIKMPIARRSGSNSAANWNMWTGRETLLRLGSWRQIPILPSCNR